MSWIDRELTDGADGLARVFDIALAAVGLIVLTPELRPSNGNNIFVFALPTQDR